MTLSYLVSLCLPSPVSVAPPPLQTEVEEKSWPPSGNWYAPHSEDWEQSLLWWGVHGPWIHRQAGVPIWSWARSVVTTSRLPYYSIWSHPVGWEVSDSGRQQNWSPHPHQWCVCLWRIQNMGEIHSTPSHSLLLPHYICFQIGTGCQWRPRNHMGHWYSYHCCAGVPKQVLPVVLCWASAICTWLHVTCYH